MIHAQRPGISRGTWTFTAIIVLCLVTYGIYRMFWSRYEHGLSETYLGPKACAKCHEQQAASWSQTRMARTFEVLKPGIKAEEKKLAGLDPAKDFTHDASCLPCHTTGYGRVGGFVSIEQTPDMAGISCECCHGPGGRYTHTVMESDPQFKLSSAHEAGLVYPPTAQMCLRCHNESSPFARLKVTFDPNKSERQGTHHHFQLRYEHGN